MADKTPIKRMGQTPKPVLTTDETTLSGDVHGAILGLFDGTG
jgi:hypothetical protein